MGTGTTGVAAKMIGRNYIGFELQNEYIELAESRISKVVEMEKIK